MMALNNKHFKSTLLKVQEAVCDAELHPELKGLKSGPKRNWIRRHFAEFEKYHAVYGPWRTMQRYGNTSGPGDDIGRGNPQLLHDEIIKPPKEHERTPEAVAVMWINGGDRRGSSFSAGILQQTYSPWFARLFALRVLALGKLHS